MTEALVSIYIPCKNYAHFVTESIESVIRQSYENWELILIDNGSSDNTSDVFQLYQSDPRITILENSSDTIASAANLAIKHAKGAFIVRLDADDVFEENALLVMASHLMRRESCDMVAPGYYLMDDKGNVFAHEMREQLRKQNHQMDLPPNGACTMMRVSMLKELGGYREELNAQDGFDLWSRASDKYTLENIKLPLFYYRRHGSNLTDSSERIFIARRNIKKFKADDTLNKYHPIIAVIPCRQHYDFSENLWAEAFNGHTLLSLCIEKCVSSKLFDHIVVLSDTDAVKEEIKRFDDPRIQYIARPPELTIRSCPLAESIAVIANHVENFEKGISVLQYLQAPLVSLESIEEAITTLVINHADSSVAMDEISIPVYQRSPDGLIPVGNNENVINDFRKLYAESRTCHATLNSNVSKGTLVGSRVVHFEVPHKESFFIKNQNDMKIARLLTSNNE